MRGSRCDMRSFSWRSPYALLVDAHLQGVAVGRNGAQCVARRQYLGSGCGQQAGDLAGAHAGGLLDQLSLALRCSSGAADTVPGDSSATGSSRSGSGAREAVCRDSAGATTGSGTGVDADAGRSVGGRSSGAGHSSDDGAAAPAPGAATGAQEGAGNGDAFPFNSGRGSGGPACAAPGACAPERLATGTADVFPAATSPEHPPAGGAKPGADRCPRSPCSSASPGAAGSPSSLVPPAQSWS